MRTPSGRPSRPTDGTWETHDEAESANGAAAEWVAANIADRIQLKDAHVGDFFFDEGP